MGNPTKEAKDAFDRASKGQHGPEALALSSRAANYIPELLGHIRDLEARCAELEAERERLTQVIAWQDEDLPKFEARAEAAGARVKVLEAAIMKHRECEEPNFDNDELLYTVLALQAGADKDG